MNNKNARERITAMNTLTATIDHARLQGYTENFIVTDAGLCVEAKNKCFSPTQVVIVDFFRFEGESDPGDESVLYVIETVDGTLGILVDAYGLYANETINRFIQSVKDINKQPD
jgi:hypothetical protein